MRARKWGGASEPNRYVNKKNKTSRFLAARFCVSGNADILLGVNLFITHMDFKMQVWAGGVAGVDGKRDFVALGNNVND